MFACIHVPDFPVEAIARRAPLLRERAVVVLEGKPPLVRVAALNDKARQLGLNVGMTKMQAAIFATEHGSSPDAGKPSRIKPGHIDRSRSLPSWGKSSGCASNRYLLPPYLLPPFLPLPETSSLSGTRHPPDSLDTVSDWQLNTPRHW